MNKKKTNNFLIQGSILTIAALIAKVIGMIYRVPLTNIIGNDGNGYYSTANNVYTIVLMVSSFSLPLAVSRLIAERLNKGENRNAHKVFICSLKFALLVGGVISVVTFAFARVITKYVMNLELAYYGLRVLCPAMFLFAIVGVFRGFFQGHQNMVPTAISQVIEQIVNAVVSVVCAGMLVNYALGMSGGEKAGDIVAALGAAGGTMGTVVSIGVALIFILVIYAMNYNSYRKTVIYDESEHIESNRSIYRALILTIIPIVLSTLAYNLNTVIDQGIYNAVEKGAGIPTEQYNSIYGIYSGKFVVLMNVPLAIASCMAPAVVPSLASAVEMGNRKLAIIKTRDTIRYTMLLTIPCAVGMMVLADPIMQLIFPGSSSMAGGILEAGGILIVFLAYSTITTGILQGLGDLKSPLIHCVIALVSHIIVLLVLLIKFKLNIYGVLYANVFFAAVICILNARSMWKILHYRQEINKTFTIPLISSGVMALVVLGVYHFFHLFAGNTIPTILSVLAGMATYLFVMIRLRGITDKDIYGIPMGDKIARILIKARIL